MQGPTTGLGRENPPAGRPTESSPPPKPHPQTRISNRDTKLLETAVTERKQTTRPRSNRDKNALFSSAFLSLTALLSLLPQPQIDNRHGASYISSRFRGARCTTLPKHFQEEP